jgi:hypothetical protein
MTGHSDADPMNEDAAAFAMGRELQALAERTKTGTSAPFVDGVMAALATEPGPKPSIALTTAARERRPRGVLSAIGDTWRVAFSGGRPFAVRAQALAFVLVVIVASGSLGGVVAAGAWGMVVRPQTTVPLPTDHGLLESARPTPPPSVLPGVVAAPTASPVAGMPEATETPRASDDAGSTAAPTRSPEHTRTPTARPTETDHRTPRPTETSDDTPEPTDTDEPDPTDDHGGDDADPSATSGSDHSGPGGGGSDDLTSGSGIDGGG